MYMKFCLYLRTCYLPQLRGKMQFANCAALADIVILCMKFCLYLRACYLPQLRGKMQFANCAALPDIVYTAVTANICS